MLSLINHAFASGEPPSGRAGAARLVLPFAFRVLFAFLGRARSSSRAGRRSRGRARIASSSLTSRHGLLASARVRRRPARLPLPGDGEEAEAAHRLDRDRQQPVHAGAHAQDIEPRRARDLAELRIGLAPGAPRAQLLDLEFESLDLGGEHMVLRRQRQLRAQAIDALAEVAACGKRRIRAARRGVPQAVLLQLRDVGLDHPAQPVRAERLQARLCRLEVGHVLFQARVQVHLACRHALAVLRGEAKRGGKTVGGHENEQPGPRRRAQLAPVAPLPGDEERQQRLQPVEGDRQQRQKSGPCPPTFRGCSRTRNSCAWTAPSPRAPGPLAITVQKPRTTTRRSSSTAPR